MPKRRLHHRAQKEKAQHVEQDMRHIEVRKHIGDNLERLEQPRARRIKRHHLGNILRQQVDSNEEDHIEDQQVLDNRGDRHHIRTNIRFSLRLEAPEHFLLRHGDKCLPARRTGIRILRRHQLLVQQLHLLRRHRIPALPAQVGRQRHRNMLDRLHLDILTVILKPVQDIIDRLLRRDQIRYDRRDAMDDKAPMPKLRDIKSEILLWIVSGHNNFWIDGL